MVLAGHCKETLTAATGLKALAVHRQGSVEVAPLTAPY